MSLAQVFFGLAIALHELMKKIIVVSRCLKIPKNEPQTAEFSFRGYYLGSQIKSLLITKINEPWEKNEEYRSSTTNVYVDCCPSNGGIS